MNRRRDVKETQKTVRLFFGCRRCHARDDDPEIEAQGIDTRKLGFRWVRKARLSGVGAGGSEEYSAREAREGMNGAQWACLIKAGGRVRGEGARCGDCTARTELSGEKNTREIFDDRPAFFPMQANSSFSRGWF